MRVLIFPNKNLQELLINMKLKELLEIEKERKRNRKIEKDMSKGPEESIDSKNKTEGQTKKLSENSWQKRPIFVKIKK